MYFDEFAPNPTPANGAFPNCQFRWGRNWNGSNNVDLSPYDYVTFWIGAPNIPPCKDIAKQATYTTFKSHFLRKSNKKNRNFFLSIIIYFPIFSDSLSFN